MQHSPRPRRFRKIVTAFAKRTGMITSAALLTGSGFSPAEAQRWAGQITRVAEKAGVVATGTVFATHGGRARAVKAFEGRDLVALMLAVATYRPSLTGTVTKKGAPSKSVESAKKRIAYFRYTAVLAGRPILAPARYALAA